jgi:hypothetical protein
MCTILKKNPKAQGPVAKEMGQHVHRGSNDHAGYGMHKAQLIVSVSTVTACAHNGGISRREDLLWQNRYTVQSAAADRRL